MPPLPNTPSTPETAPQGREARYAFETVNLSGTVANDVNKMVTDIQTRLRAVLRLSKAEEAKSFFAENKGQIEALLKSDLDTIYKQFLYNAAGSGVLLQAVRKRPRVMIAGMVRSLIFMFLFCLWLGYGGDYRPDLGRYQDRPDFRGEPALVLNLFQVKEFLPCTLVN